MLLPRHLPLLHWNVILQGTGDAQDVLGVTQVSNLALRPVIVLNGW